MTDPNKRILVALMAATALLFAGGAGGAVAAGKITSDQIKNRTITKKDLRNGSVTTRGIKNGTVRSVDLSAALLAGITGPAGAQGEVGPAGAPGASGAQGVPGVAATNGADGLDGADGPQGPKGLQGESGQDGAEGPQGPAGPQGEAGPQGSAGPQGDVGPAGGNIAGSTVVTVTAIGIKVTASCPSGTFAIGGGGMSSSNRTLDGSYPSNSAGVPVENDSTSPTSWTASFSQSGSQTAYAICAG